MEGAYFAIGTLVLILSAFSAYCLGLAVMARYSPYSEEYQTVEKYVNGLRHFLNVSRVLVAGGLVVLPLMWLVGLLELL